MDYTLQNIQEQFSIVAEEVENYIRDNKVKVGKKGRITPEVYQAMFDFYNKEKYAGVEKPIYVLNGHMIKVKNTPFFESENQRVSIFHEDAIDFLKSLPASSVDIIITDPAYSGMNQKLKLGSGKIIGKYRDAGKSDAKWFEEFHDTEENYKSFLTECYRVLKDNRHIYIMFDSYSLLTLAPVIRDVFEVKNILCWDKVNIGLGHYFRRRHEFIMFASKGKRALNSKSIPDVWRVKRVVSSQYPTQKPTEVFELMLKGSVDKDYVVCDPFLGSGSSAIAALKSNCKFIGCDISEKSMTFAKDRIDEYIRTKNDKYQKTSLIADDDAIVKLLQNGKPE